MYFSLSLRGHPKIKKMLKRFRFFFPTIGQCWIILLLTVAGQLLASLAVMPLMNRFKDSSFVTLFLPYVLTFVIPFLYIYLKGRSAEREYEVTGSPEPAVLDRNDFGRLHPVELFIVLAISVYAFSFASDPLNVWMPAPEWFTDLMKQVTGGDSLFWSFLTVGIMAPVLEETVCRGVICRGLLRHYRSPWPAILWSALIFAVMHLNPWQGIPAFLMGVYFGWIYYRTGSLKATMFLHFVNNGTAVLLEHFSETVSTNESLYDLFPDKDLYWLCTALCIALFVFANVLFLNKYLPKPETNNSQYARKEE